MRIEKVNDNQIKCTLTKEDLENRNLKLSELAYGTDGARSLFHDMMEQASYEVGFEVGDIPIMIEAIPVNADSLVLIITKIEFPDELDTRFSRFTPSNDTSDTFESFAKNRAEGADSILDLYKQMIENSGARGAGGFVPLKEAIAGGFTRETDDDKKPRPDIRRVFTFKSFNSLIRAAHVLEGFYTGKNTLYKNPKTGEYILTVSNSTLEVADFNKVCNVLSEYATPSRYTPLSPTYFEEHLTSIREDNALEFLSTI